MVTYFPVAPIPGIFKTVLGLQYLTIPHIRAFWCQRGMYTKRCVWELHGLSAHTFVHERAFTRLNSEEKRGQKLGKIIVAKYAIVCNFPEL